MSTQGGCRSALMACALSVLPLSGFGQGSHLATLAESLSRTSIRAPAISPDARSVAYLQRETNWKENEFVWQLWRVDVGSGKAVQLTRGKKSVASAAWSPDGRWLAFVTEREANVIEPYAAVEKDVAAKEDGKSGTSAAKPAAKQIWVIAPDGGEAWPLTKSETDVDEFQWTKDGKWIVFTAAEPPNKGGKARKERYSSYDVVEKDYEQHQLWGVDADAAIKTLQPQSAMQLTSDPALTIKSFAISGQSDRVAFSAGHNPLLAFNMDEDIYLMDLPRAAGSSPGTVTKIVALPGPDRVPMFSLDGRQLAFVTSLGQPKFFYANTHIALVDIATVLKKPAATAADVRDLTQSFDEDPDALEWVPGGLYFGATQKMTAKLFRLDGSSWQIQPVSTDDHLIINEASVTPDGAAIAFTADDATHLTELYISSAKSFAPKKLTDQTAQVSAWKLGSVEVVSWKSKDGTVIEGVLHKPADYDPKRKYPLLV
ncbi:MAG TPA: hypothetical protein VN891_05430, partial [Steroidobacteraceae bacterium]|nr:hypothetical protein [Steroidobacteraceae bacterium]